MTGEKKELNNEEIDTVLKEESEERDLSLQYAEKNGLTADLFGSDSTSSTSSSGAMKQTLLCSQPLSTSKITCTYVATWLDEAYYRGIDVCGVTVSNVDLVQDSWTCKHTATYRCISQYGDYSQSMSTSPTAYFVADTGSGVSFQVDLFGDRDSINSAALVNTFESYSDEKITITFKGTVKDSSLTYCTYTSNYWHLKTSKSVTPSVSFSAGGFDVSISGSSTNYYEKITNNAYLAFKHV